jgi:hypothetical protein
MYEFYIVVTETQSRRKKAKKPYFINDFLTKIFSASNRVTFTQLFVRMLQLSYVNMFYFLKNFNKKVPKIVFLKLRIENNVSLFCAQVPHIQFLVDLVAMTLLLLHLV